MSVVLVLGICVFGGTLRAMAQEGGASPTPVAQASDEGVALGQQETEGVEVPAEGDEGVVASGGEQALPEGNGETAVGDELGANATRAGPAEEASPTEEVSPAEKASPTEEDEGPAPLRTRGTPKEVPATIADFVIQDLSGNTANEMYVTNWFYLAMNWDASSSGASLHEGDYFDIVLPDQMMFPSDSSAVDFNIYGDDGTTVIAKAHVSPGPGDRGGSVRVAFTDWVEGRENVKGNIRLSAQFDQRQVVIGQPNTFQVQVGSQVLPTTVTVTGPTDLQPEVLSKWGQGVDDAEGAPVPDVAEWHIRINHQKATLTNVVMTDHLSEGEGDETYIAGSFRLRRVEMSSMGGVLQVYETDDTADLSGRLTIAADGKSFTLNLGDIDGDQYRLSYRTTYKPGTKLRNNVTPHVDRAYRDGIQVPSVGELGRGRHG